MPSHPRTSDRIPRWSAESLRHLLGGCDYSDVILVF